MSNLFCYPPWTVTITCVSIYLNISDDVRGPSQCRHFLSIRSRGTNWITSLRKHYRMWCIGMRTTVVLHVGKRKWSLNIWATYNEDHPTNVTDTLNIIPSTLVNISEFYFIVLLLSCKITIMRSFPIGDFTCAIIHQRTSLKAGILETYVIPVLTYGCQTWSLSYRLKQMIQVCQRKMERKITMSHYEIEYDVKT